MQCTPDDCQAKFLKFLVTHVGPFTLLPACPAADPRTAAAFPPSGLLSTMRRDMCIDVTAGVSRIGPLVEQPLAEMRELFEANLWGVLRVTQVGWWAAGM